MPRLQAGKPIVSAAGDVCPAEVQDVNRAAASEAGPQVVRQTPRSSTSPSSRGQGRRISPPIHPTIASERQGIGVASKAYPQPAPRSPADIMASVVMNLQQWEERVSELADRLMRSSGTR